MYSSIASLACTLLLGSAAASVPARHQRRQSGPVPPDTVSDCTFFIEAQSGDTCQSIADADYISKVQFISYDPSVKPDCSGLVVGDSYCVEENYGNGPLPTSTSTSTSVPTQTGIVQNCERFYDVQPGDSCSSIVNKFGTFTLADFYSWNPAVQSDCSKLYAGYDVCVGVPGTPTSAPPAPTTSGYSGPSPTQTGIISSCTKYHQAASGDSCYSIAQMFGTFTVEQFEQWNPAVGSDCSHLFLGYYYCVAVPGTPTASPSTSTMATPTAPSPTGPSPTQSGIISNCTKYYQAASGDSCATIVNQFGTFTVGQFESWNPAVGSDCSHLFLGYHYCIGIPGTPTTRPALPPPSPTGMGPQPQQSGIVSNCNKYYQVQSGQGCFDIEQATGITANQFFAWNTGIKSDCSNLFSGYYTCVGVS